MVDGQGTAGKPMQHTKEIAPAGQAEEAQTTVDSKLESVISVVNTSELSKQYQCLTRINMFFFLGAIMFACDSEQFGRQYSI